MKKPTTAPMKGVCDGLLVKIVEKSHYGNTIAIQNYFPFEDQG